MSRSGALTSTSLKSSSMALTQDLVDLCFRDETDPGAIGGHTPHVLRDALSWHLNLEETGRMIGV